MSAAVPYIEFDDGLRMQYIEEQYIDKVRQVFTRIWLAENVLYRAVGVTEEEIAPYVDLLMRRARLDPFSCAMCLDISDAANERVIGFMICVDPFDDPVDANVDGAAELDVEAIGTSPEQTPPDAASQPYCTKLQVIFEFNSYLTSTFFKNPLFESLREPHKVIYGLHGGVLPEYSGRKEFGASVLRRMGAFHAINMWQRGYKAMLGVQTHGITVRRGYEDVRKTPYTIMLSALDYKDWRPRKTAWPADQPPPFSDIDSPTHATCTLSVFPQRQHRRSSHSAKAPSSRL